MAPAVGEVNVVVRVRGPNWVTADKVELYANGHKVREAPITDGKQAGLKWFGEWRLPPCRHGVHLVALASGPGVEATVSEPAPVPTPSASSTTPRVGGRSCSRPWAHTTRRSRSRRPPSCKRGGCPCKARGFA